MESLEDDEAVAFETESGAEAARPKVEACRRMEASVDMHSVREYTDMATECSAYEDRERARRKLSREVLRYGKEKKECGVEVGRESEGLVL